jgi:hypothetical protein
MKEIMKLKHDKLDIYKNYELNNISKAKFIDRSEEIKSKIAKI